MIFAPLLTSLMYPGVSIEGQISQTPVLSFFSNLWEPDQYFVLRASGPHWGRQLRTFSFSESCLLVLFAAFTLRTSVKPKPK